MTLSRPTPEQFHTTENAFQVYKTVGKVINYCCCLAFVVWGVVEGASFGFFGVIVYAFIGFVVAWFALLPITFLLQIPFWLEHKYEDALMTYELPRLPSSKSAGTGHPMDAYGDIGDSGGE